MKTYKGFKEGLVCRDYQYDIGKIHIHEGKIDLCNSGFHSCKIPLDTWNYYPPSEQTEYAVCEVDGEIKESDEDSKIVSTELTPIKNITIKELVNEYIGVIKQLENKSSTVTARFNSHAVTSKRHSHVATTGENSHAITAGAFSHAATIKDRSHAVTAGDFSHAVTVGGNSHTATVGGSSRAATIGYNSHAITAGNGSHVTTFGNRSHAVTAGNYTRAITMGKNSHAVTAGSNSCVKSKKGRAGTFGDYSTAEALSEDAVAVVMGKHGKVKGVIGSRLICAWWKDGKIVGVRTVKITKKSRIRPGKWYRVNSKGKWEETETGKVVSR